MDAIALGLGYVIIIGIAVFLLVLLTYTISTILYRSIRFWKLKIDADKVHGDVIKSRYKEKIFYKGRLLLRIIESKGIELLFMGEGDRICNHKWSYSISKSYVIAKR